MPFLGESAWGFSPRSLSQGLPIQGLKKCCLVPYLTARNTASKQLFGFHVNVYFSFLFCS